MKKNKIVKFLLVGCFITYSYFNVTTAVFASEESDNQDKKITEYNQKLIQIQESLQKFTSQKEEKATKLNEVIEEIEVTESTVSQSESMNVSTSLSSSSSKTNNLVLSLLSTASVEKTTSNSSDYTLANSKEKLTELNEEFTTLTSEINSLTDTQSSLQEEEKKITEELTNANQERNDEAKQSDTRSAIVNFAKEQLGKPYVYGAAGPDSFDCSGLVQAAFASAGLSIGRTTVNQELAGSIISVSEAQLGDLVFWGSQGSTYHVAISLGDGTYIHAPVPGDVVQIATVSSYTPDFAVRVL